MNITVADVCERSRLAIEKFYKEEPKKISTEDKRCPSFNPKAPTQQCGLPKGHIPETHTKAPYHSWEDK